MLANCDLKLIDEGSGFAGRQPDHVGRQDFWDASNVRADAKQSTACSFENSDAESLRETRVKEDVPTT